MKKLLTLLLVLTMALALTACGSKSEESGGSGSKSGEITGTADENQTDSDDANAESSEAPANPDEAPASPDEAPVTDGAEVPADGDLTLGGILLDAFKNYVAENPDADTQTIADAIVHHEVIEFEGMVMEAVPGFLTGFDNAEITGFETGAVFAPGIGSIPFVGYVFELADDADVDAFMTTLKDNANPRWNICTEADETIVDAVDNKVFFLMCPFSMEQ